MKWTNKGHELDQLIISLRQMKHLYIFGVGGNAQEMLYMISGMKRPLPCDLVLIDSNEEKQRCGYKGRIIHSPQYLYDMLSEDSRIVVAPSGPVCEEICRECLAHGAKPEQIFDGGVFLYRILPVYLSDLYRQVIFYSVNMLPSTVCNLNCRDCLNFNPHIRRHITYSLEKCKENVDLFFRAVNLV